MLLIVICGGLKVLKFQKFCRRGYQNDSYIRHQGNKIGMAHLEIKSSSKAKEKRADHDNRQILWGHQGHELYWRAKQNCWTMHASTMENMVPSSSALPGNGDNACIWGVQQDIVGR